METPKPPSYMTAVEKEQFFKLLYAETRDIMPSVEYPEFTLWKIRGVSGDGYAWGWSTPGWHNAMTAVPVYAVANVKKEGAK